MNYKNYPRINSLEAVTAIGILAWMTKTISGNVMACKRHFYARDCFFNVSLAVCNTEICFFKGEVLIAYDIQQNIIKKGRKSKLKTKFKLRKVFLSTLLNSKQYTKIWTISLTHTYKHTHIIKSMNIWGAVSIEVTSHLAYQFGTDYEWKLFIENISFKHVYMHIWLCVWVYLSLIYIL